MDDWEWPEGRPQLRVHRERERGRGLTTAKKAQYRRIHGKLSCERCGIEPATLYSTDHAEFCIEVHHAATMVSRMEPEHRTKLEDLECLCASCHRLVHKLIAMEIDESSILWPKNWTEKAVPAKV